MRDANQAGTVALSVFMTRHAPNAMKKLLHLNNIAKSGFTVSNSSDVSKDEP